MGLASGIVVGNDDPYISSPNGKLLFQARDDDIEFI